MAAIPFVLLPLSIGYDMLLERRTVSSSAAEDPRRD